jgi:hypothetical protein
MAARRSYGSGRIVVRTDGRGVETFHGVWRSDGRQVKRRLGLKRPRGGREGPTAAHVRAQYRPLEKSPVNQGFSLPRRARP